MESRPNIPRDTDVPRPPYTAAPTTVSHASRRLLGLLYLAGVLVIVDQLADLAASILAKNPTPALASWRFGLFGLLISRSSVFLIADVMLFIAAIRLGHRKVIRSLGALHFLAAVLLIAGLIGFALDWAELRLQVPEAGVRSFQYSTLRAAVLAFLLTGICVWTGFVAFRATRSHDKQRVASPLLTGTHRDEATE